MLFSGTIRTYPLPMCVNGKASHQHSTGFFPARLRQKKMPLPMQCKALIYHLVLNSFRQMSLNSAHYLRLAGCAVSLNRKVYIMFRQPYDPSTVTLAGYVRRSSEMQKDNFSIDAQKRAITEAAK